MENSTDKKDMMFQRLAFLVKQRFDTNITFTDFSARMRIADVKTVTAVQRNPKSNFIIMGNEIVLPIRNAENLYGFVTLFDGIRLTEIQLEQVRQVTDLLLTESCILEDKTHRSKVLEHHLKLSNSFEEVADIRKKIGSEDTYFIDPEISISYSEEDSAVVYPILIESHSAPEAQELAIEIHRVSQTGSFITVEDYLLPELQSVEKIMSLGAITLFVSNVATLSPKIQSVLVDFLNSSQRTNIHPRVICAIQENPETLISSGELLKNLFDKIQTARIKLPPKGTSSMSLEEMLGFFVPDQPPPIPQQRHLFLVSPEEPKH